MSRFVPYILDIVPKIQFGSIKSIESKVFEIVSNESSGTVKRYFDSEESIRTVHLIYCPKIQFGLIKSIESSSTVDLFWKKHLLTRLDQTKKYFILILWIRINHIKTLFSLNPCCHFGKNFFRHNFIFETQFRDKSINFIIIFFITSSSKLNFSIS